MKIAMLGPIPKLPLQIPEGSYIHRLFEECSATCAFPGDFSVLDKGNMPKSGEIDIHAEEGTVEMMVSKVGFGHYDAAFISVHEVTRVNLALLGHHLVALNVSHDEYHEGPFIYVEPASRPLAFLVVRSDCPTEKRMKLMHFAYLLSYNS